MTEITKESVEAALEQAKEAIAPKVEEAKTEIEQAAKSNVWPLLAGAFVLGSIVGGALGWLLS